MKIKKNIKYFFKLIFLIFIFNIIGMKFSYAYIDPGSGSFILQTLALIFASIGFYLGYPIRILKKLFKKKKKKDRK